LTVKELIEQLSKYREDAIVTVRVKDMDYPVIGHKVQGCFNALRNDWRNAPIDFWICSLSINEDEYIERVVVYGK